MTSPAHAHTYIHTTSPTITPPSLSYFLFPCCFSVLHLSLEKLLTCGVIWSYNFKGFFRVSLGSLHKTSAPPRPLNNALHLQHYKTSAPPPFLNIMLHLQHHKRSTPPPPVITTSHLGHPKTISPATPLNTTLHLQYHKRSTLPPPLNNTLHLEHHKRSDPPRPFERYVTS